MALLLAREGVYDVQGAREVEHEDLEALAALAEATDEDGRRAEVAWRQARFALMIADTIDGKPVARYARIRFCEGT